jgi:RNA polymerase sigma-70 factor (ECF subfamily)
VRSGDPDAFAELFESFARAVYNHAFRMTADWSAAEDAVALTFLEAWRLRAKVDEEGGSLRPWLLGIATNVLRNTARANRRRRAAHNRLPAERSTPDFADDVAGRMDDVVTMARVRAILHRLRREEREVVALCVWSELDHASAAEALGIPISTVRSRLFRARRKLRDLAGEPAGFSGQVPGDGTRLARPRQETS